MTGRAKAAAAMAAWQHLAPGRRAGRKTRHGQGHGAAGHDEVLRAGPALARVEVGVPVWSFPRALLRIILVVFSFQRRVELWGSVSQPVTTHAAIIAGSVFLCAILHMLFIWPCDCVMSKWPRTAIDEVCGRPHDQQQGSEPHRRDGDEGGSALDGGLAGEWTGLPRVEGRGRCGGQLGGPGLERLAQGVADLGMRVVSHVRILGIAAY